jgi:hypothetical protein
MVGNFPEKTFYFFSSICGESADVCEEAVAEWNEKLCALMDDYEPKDIANCDETGLFFQALPNKTLCLKGEKCSGGKLSKQRLTIFLCDVTTEDDLSDITILLRTIS